MKTKSLNLRPIAAFCLAMFLTAFAAPSVTAQSRSYQLDCRSGGDMRAFYLINFTEDLPIRIFSIAQISFRPAARASSEEAPGPGECAWVDRPLNSDEPHGLELIIRNVNIDFFVSSDGVEIVTFGPSSATLFAIQRPGRLFSVMVHNNNDGALVIDSELER